jgi:hypothetical protein
MPVAMPSSIPRALAQGHSQQEADIAESCEYEAGEPRRAPIYTTVPNVVELRWRLTQAQMTDFHNWYEADLNAAHLTFNVPIAEQGSAGVVTVEAMFLAPPTYTAQEGGRWLVAARVITGVPLESFGQAAAGLSVGWANPLRATDGTATYAHANSGTNRWGPVTGQINAGSGGVRLPRAGIVGYDVINSPPVVWSLVWAPLASDPAPTYTVIGTLDGDEIQINFANIGFPDRTSAGLLTISATVDGVPTGDSVQMAVGAGSYNTMAWGPTP